MKAIASDRKVSRARTPTALHPKLACGVLTAVVLALTMQSAYADSYKMDLDSKMSSMPMIPPLIKSWGSTTLE
jgi:hypothetical protein